MSNKRKKAASVAKIAKDKLACNKAKKTPSHPTKSHVVKACKDGKEKIIRFGQQGVKGAGKNPKTAKQRQKHSPTQKTERPKAGVPPKQTCAPATP